MPVSSWRDGMGCRRIDRQFGTPSISPVVGRFISGATHEEACALDGGSIVVKRPVPGS